jgi:hypothetical protein
MEMNDAPRTLRDLMHGHGIHHASYLLPLLADRGVARTESQIDEVVDVDLGALDADLLSAALEIFEYPPV